MHAGIPTEGSPFLWNRWNLWKHSTPILLRGRPENHKSNLIPCASGSVVPKLIVLVCRRM